MTPISVWKGMDEDEAMMEADGNLIWRVGLRLDPEAHIIEQLAQIDRNAPMVHADIAL